MEEIMDVIKFAINMELEGQRFYLEQAEINKDNELQRVFQLLADSEKEHAEILEKKQNREDYELSDSGDTVLPLFRNVFVGMKDFTKKHVVFLSQLEAYRLARSQEEKSIKLYQKMDSETNDLKDKELFEFLIKQEQEHLILFDQLVTMVTRPEEWVESAEFGLREEY